MIGIPSVVCSVLYTIIVAHPTRFTHRTGPLHYGVDTWLLRSQYINTYDRTFRVLSYLRAILPKKKLAK